MKLRVGIALVASLLAGSADAQSMFDSGGFRPLTTTSTATLNVTTSSSSANANNALQALVCNIGTVEAFVAITGASGTAATTSGMSFPGGFCTTLQLNPGNYLAAITASSSTTLRVTFAAGAGPVAWSGGSGGGGGGGLSVTDQTAFTQGSSQFTPSGGVFNDSATLSSGQEGTYRMTTKRAQIVDVDTTGNALYTAINSGVGTPGSAVPTTGIYVGGNVSGLFRAWTGVNPSGSIYAQQFDAASVGGTAVGTYGSAPGSVPAVPVNANITNTVATTTTPSYGAAQLSHQVISISSSGNNIAITRAVGTIKVYQLELSCASQLTTITPQDGTSTSLGAKSATQYIYEGLQTEPIYTTTGTNNFVINLSAGVTCTGFAKYKDS